MVGNEATVIKGNEFLKEHVSVKENETSAVFNPKTGMLLIIVSALGYFVDVYDMMLFTVVRKASLISLGVAEADTLSVGLRLLNFQTVGLLIGGVFWGILGDKKGRLTVLFGSIIIYSVANILNGFVTGIEQYSILRVVAGFGLAGELGAGVTMVMESMKKETRTIGATIVAGFGLTGAIVAGYIGQHFEWRTAYIIGGSMGLLLLLLRVGVYESDMYTRIQDKNIQKGNFLNLFLKYKKFVRYAKTILVGLPSYFVLGLLLTIAPEFAKETHLPGVVNTGQTMMFCFAGFCTADFCCGLLSHWLKSRKKVFYLFNLITLISIITFFYFPAETLGVFYAKYVLAGFGIGYWAMLVTNASEQFGTNYRSTVTTTVPNFIRGALIPISLIFESLKQPLGLINSAVITGVATVLIALIATWYSQETFSKDLNYTE